MHLSTVQMATSFTMGLELCGRRDNGSIWGPAVLPCNETLKYKYRVKDKIKLCKGLKEISKCT